MTASGRSTPASSAWEQPRPPRGQRGDDQRERVLRTSNEELLVANEEVQAATEEVETLNEELQAANEELETLNEELQATVEELNTTNDDLAARSQELQETAASLAEQRQRSDRSAPAGADPRRDDRAVLASTATAGRSRRTAPTCGFRDRRPAGPRGRVRAGAARIEWPHARAARGETFAMSFAARRSGDRRWYEVSGRPGGDWRRHRHPRHHGAEPPPSPGALHRHGEPRAPDAACRAARLPAAGRAASYDDPGAAAYLAGAVEQSRCLGELAPGCSTCR